MTTKAPFNLDDLILMKGTHSRREDGVCLLEAVAWFADLKHTDHPACTDSVVAAYARALNDVMPDDQRYRLKPFIPRLAATSNGCPPEKRAFMSADRAVRVFAVAALQVAGLDQWAKQLSELEPVTDKATAAAAGAAAAGGAAAGAAAAGWSPENVAGAAAGAAAWAAATAAAGGAAAGAAAGAVAWAAAWAAAGAADPWTEPLQLLDDLIEAKP